MNNSNSIIDSVEEFILNSYPNIYLSKKENFIGGKFKTIDKFFIFYINLYNDKFYLAFRENYLLKQCTKIIIDSLNENDILKIIQLTIDNNMNKYLSLNSNNNNNISHKKQTKNKEKEIKTIKRERKKGVHITLSDNYYNIPITAYKNDISDIDYDNYIEFSIKIGELTNSIIDKYSNKRNVEIFKKRTNLLSFDNPTLQNIGNDYNLTRERIRQIVKKISRNLKRHKDKYILLFNNIANTNYINYFFYGIINLYNEYFLKILLDILNNNLYYNVMNKIYEINNTKKQFYKQQLYDNKFKDALVINKANSSNQKSLNELTFNTLVKERELNDENSTRIVELKNINKMLEYESLLEKTILLKLDKISFIKDIKTQSLKIPYKYNNSSHFYYPDVQLITKNNNIIILEIKPLLKMFEEFNLIKYIVLKNFCNENNYSYAIIDDRYNTIEKIKNINVDLKKENYFIEFVKQNQKITYRQFKIIKEKINLTIYELFNILIRNHENLTYTSTPFIIKYINKN